MHHCLKPNPCWNYINMLCEREVARYLSWKLNLDCNYFDLSAGIVNFKFKDFKAAVEDLSTCVKIDRDNKSAYTYLVSACYQTLLAHSLVNSLLILACLCKYSVLFWANLYCYRVQRCLQLVNTKGPKMHIKSPLNLTRIILRHGFT